MTSNANPSDAGPLTLLAGTSGFYEDFPVGRRMHHVRSATVTDIENNQLSKQMMNSAQAHWNEHLLDNGRVVYGLVVASMVFGLASQDTAAQALAELDVSGIQFLSPVRQGTTLTAYSEVIVQVADADHPDAGRVSFQHYGVNQEGVLVFRGQRTLRIKRRSHWFTR